MLALLPAALPALDLTVGAGAAQNCPAAPTGISFSAGAIAYLEPAPVVTFDDYGDGHYAPSRGNNIGIGIGFGEFTGEIEGYCVDALYRAEYIAAASRDILDALVANHVGAPFDSGRTYGLSLSEDSFKASGLRIRRVIDFEFTEAWSASIGLGLSVLKALDAQRESVSGSATATSGSYAVGTATWLKTDTNFNLADFNHFVAPGTPDGYGFSTDFEFVARSKSGYSIDFTVMDAIGRLYWHDVPQSYRTLDNATISYNADFDRNAFVTGLDSRVSFVQALPRIYQLAATVPLLAKFSGIVEDDLIAGYHFPSVGARYGEPDRYGELNFDVRTQSVSLGARLHAMSAMITANSFEPRRATVLGITLRAAHAW